MIINNLKSILIITLLICQLIVFGQNKHLNIGYDDFGLKLGNSKRCNGARLNIWDNNVDFINGINISAKSSATNSNGISLGLIINKDSITNGIKIGGLITMSKKVNGICISAIGNGCEDKINGLAIAGLGQAADTMNGLFISVFGSLKLGRNHIDVINGMTIGAMVHTEKFNGLSIGYVSGVDTLRGANIGIVVNQAFDVHGVQLGMYNYTEDLHGIQIGLWNVAINNRFLKRTPLINFNFRKKRPAGNSKS